MGLFAEIKVTCAAGLLTMLSVAGCGDNTSSSSTDERGVIKIVYTNDTHGAIVGSLKFSSIAAEVQNLRDSGNQVLLVDAGDEIQGSVYVSSDKGLSLIKIMNKAGYQLATPGNHEFEYGISNLVELSKAAIFPYISCNFISEESGETVFPPSKIFKLGSKSVAFVGISTPESVNPSKLKFFQDSSGKYIYRVRGMDSPQDLYSTVQAAIDNVKGSVDYVIALGHLGSNTFLDAKGISSKKLIENVTGLDAFIDAHSHTKMPGQQVKDKNGKNVLLTQTGEAFQSYGVMTIDENGKISTDLVEGSSRIDANVAALEDELIQKVNAMMGKKIGTLENGLYGKDPDVSKTRKVLYQEMNLGDFFADANYWYLNEKVGMNCDLFVINAGSIGAQIEKGDVTYASIKSLEPYENDLNVVSITGQQVLDVLEFGASMIGVWDGKKNAPAERLGFMQVAGIAYTIDASVENKIVLDDNGDFQSVIGKYRVKDVKVYNRESGKYEALDLSREYAVGVSNYLLEDHGCGMSMFDKGSRVAEEVELTYQVIVDYVKSFKDNIINSKNSPLAKYSGYLLDYENPNGAGRITVKNLNYKK